MLIIILNITQRDAKMNKLDKIKSLTKYVESLKSRYSSVPSRRVDQVEVYKAWLDIEIAKAIKTINVLKS